MIVSLILMTTLFYKALTLQGEIWCWSLLGPKLLIVIAIFSYFRCLTEMESLFLKSVIAEFRSSGLEEATFGDVSGIPSSFSWILVTNFSTLALKFTFELNVVDNLTGLLSAWSKYIHRFLRGVEKLSQFCQLCYFRPFSHEFPKF